MKILCDMDGVLTKTQEYWLELYNKDYFDNVSVRDITQWEMHKFIKPECPTGRFYGYMDHTPKFFQQLQPHDGVAEALESLIDRKHDVYIVTATPRKSPTGFYDKVLWVEKHLPFFNTKNIIATHSKHMVRGDILLDDSPEHIGLFPGIKVVRDQPWNRDVKSDYRVKSLLEFVGLVKELEISDVKSSL